MIWSPPEKPYYILDYYNILAEAVNERVDFFALSGTVLEAKATPLTAPLTNLTWHFENLKKAVYTLLIHSLDARQIGGWVDFSPFPKFFDSEEENISALLSVGTRSAPINILICFPLSFRGVLSIHQR